MRGASCCQCALCVFCVLCVICAAFLTLSMSRPPAVPDPPALREAQTGSGVGTERVDAEAAEAASDEAASPEAVSNGADAAHAPDTSAENVDGTAGADTTAAGTADTAAAPALDPAGANTESEETGSASAGAGTTGAGITDAGLSQAEALMQAEGSQAESLAPGRLGSQQGAGTEQALFDADGVRRISEAAEKEAIPRIWRDEAGDLRLFSYGTEIMALSEHASSVSQLAHNRLVRNQYDSSSRLLKRIIWDVSDANPINPLSEFVFSYENDSLIPYVSDEIRYKEKRRIETIYDEKKRVQQISTHVFIPDAERLVRPVQRRGALREPAFETHGRLLSRLVFSYSEDDNKPMSVSEIRYTDSGEHTSEERYTYAEGRALPDVRRYEDGEIRLERVYKTEEDYVETLYFEGGLSLAASYVSGFKTEEVIYLDGEERARRQFDIPEGVLSREGASEGEGE